MPVMEARGSQRNVDAKWRVLSEQELLGVPPAAAEAIAQSSTWSAAGQLASSHAQSAAATAAAVPYKLVDLVKPGPSGTVASTAAVANAAHTAAIKSAPDVGPGGLLATAAAANQSRPGFGSAMQDLLRAAEKAMASGLGDWHLQVLQDISPQFQEHVLMGALGPETLKHKHKVPEQQILQLYGLLHKHCTGFQQEVRAALTGAEHTEQLLASIWIAFAQLWDECVQMAFKGEVLAAMQELQGTYAALLDTQDQLAATQQENTALKERCNEFVKANLDHMLAWRALKTKADALESEVSMLSSANNEISLRAAATNARSTQLTVQLEGLGARLVAAEQQIKDREAGLETARVAMMEKDSGLRRLEAHIAALGQQLVGAGQAAKKQDSFCSDLQRQLDNKEQMVQDAERRVADRQRAYNLLHADFVNQKAEAAEAVERAAELQKQLAAQQQKMASQQSLVARAEDWQRRWESCQMEVEDLEAINARAVMRRQELVSSYWPIMERLGQAEDAVAALSKQVQDLGHEPTASLQSRDCRSIDVDTLTASQQAAASTDGSTASRGSSQPRGETAQPQEQEQQQAVVQQRPASAALYSNFGRSSGAALIQRVISESTAPVPPMQQQDPTDPAATEQQQQQQPQPQVWSSNGGTVSLSGIDAALKAEFQHLRESYLLLEDAYWAQKQRLLSLELEVGQLRATNEQAVATAAKATATLSVAQDEAAMHASMRAKLEADLVGCRSWIRELEKTEQAYLKAMREQGALEDAAIAAQRQLEECRSALTAAQSDCKLAQATAEAVSKERTQLLQQMAQEMNKSTLVEQALQKVHKQEVGSSRAACARLQAALDQEAAELATARVQLEDARRDCSAALKEQLQFQVQLQASQQENCHLMQQAQQARTFLLKTLQKLESLEGRISFINSSSLEGNTGQSVEVAVEGAVHLLERLLVSLQCLAADAGTISNIAAAAKVEVLVQALMQGLKASVAAAAGAKSGKQGVQPAAALTVLRNAAGATNKQSVQELQRQVSVLQLQLSDSSSQLTAAISASARLQRALQLKTRAVASLERQLAAVESQVQQVRSSQASNEANITQLQQELAEAKLDYAQASAATAAQAGELQAARSRAAAAESEVQQLQQAATDAAATCANLTEQMQKAVAAGREDSLEARKASSSAAAATLQVQLLQLQLTEAVDRCSKLQEEVRECRQRADISVQSARDAEYRAVEITTLLADARRALEYTQQLLKAAETAKAAPQPEEHPVQ